MQGDTVLVTGASGFIAKHIVVQLVQAGWTVRGTVRNEARADEVRAVLEQHDLDPERCEFVGTELSSGEGWFQAASGCRYVLHTASPFPVAQPRKAEALIGPARKGTEYVLRAAARAGVERAIVTSSVAAVSYGHGAEHRRRFGEADFTNLKSRAVSSYARSKTQAERAAWDISRETGLPLSTVNPGLVLGPVLDGRLGTSAKLVAWMLSGRIPILPDVSFALVDVRDVALAHVRAMTSAVVGRRFILCAPDSPSLLQVAAVLAEAYPDRRQKLPHRALPPSIVRWAGLLSPGIAMVAEELGAAKSYDTAPARELLGMDFIPARDAVLAMAESLLRHRCA